MADPGTPASAVVRISSDISERKEAEEQIRYMAEHDLLTGLVNRLLFTCRLNHALAEGGMVALHRSTSTTSGRQRHPWAMQRATLLIGRHQPHARLPQAWRRYAARRG